MDHKHLLICTILELIILIITIIIIYHIYKARRQFFIVYTLWDYRNDVKMFKQVEPRDASKWFHYIMLVIGSWCWTLSAAKKCKIVVYLFFCFTLALKALHVQFWRRFVKESAAETEKNKLPHHDFISVVKMLS